MNPEINWTKWGAIGTILSIIIFVVAYEFPKSLPATTSKTGDLSAVGTTVFQNAAIQNVNINITEAQPNITIQNTSTSSGSNSPTELLQKNLLLVALKSNTDGPILPVSFGLPPGSSTQESSGLYRTQINGVVAVAPGSRAPWVDAITPLSGVHCTLPTLTTPLAVIVSGEHVGRIAYVFTSECTANYEITAEDMSNINVHYNY